MTAKESRNKSSKYIFNTTLNLQICKSITGYRVLSVYLIAVSVWLLILTTTIQSSEGAALNPIGKQRSSRDRGCYYMLQHYKNAEQIKTDEPCLNCTCENSMLMCYLKVCPYVKPVGDRCIIERVPGECCPRITCPEVSLPADTFEQQAESETALPITSTTTTSSTPAVPTDSTLTNTNSGNANYTTGCMLGDRHYHEGAQMPSDPKKPCEVCYCIKNSSACVMQDCALEVSGCAPVYTAGGCCPSRYNCSAENAFTTPRPGFGSSSKRRFWELYPGMLDSFTTEGITNLKNATISTTTTTSPLVLPEFGRSGNQAGTAGCRAPNSNRIFADGERVPSRNKCEHCYCMRSEIVCAVQECRPPCDGCVPIIDSNDQCCPKRYECVAPTKRVSTDNVIDSQEFALPSNNTQQFATETPAINTLETSGAPLSNVSSINGSEHRATDELSTTTGTTVPTSESSDMIHMEVGGVSEVPKPEVSVMTTRQTKPPIRPISPKLSTQEDGIASESPLESETSNATKIDPKSSNVDGFNLHGEREQESDLVKMGNRNEVYEGPMGQPDSNEALPPSLTSTISPRSTDETITTTVTASVHLESTETSSEAHNLINGDRKSRPLVVPSTIPGEGSCRYKGQIYQNGEEVRYKNNCTELCLCVNSVIYCDEIDCPKGPSDPDKCQKVSAEGDCCPKYICPEEANISSTPSGSTKTDEELATKSPANDIPSDISKVETSTSAQSTAITISPININPTNIFNTSIDQAEQASNSVSNPNSAVGSTTSTLLSTVNLTTDSPTTNAPELQQSTNAPGTSDLNSSSVNDKKPLDEVAQDPSVSNQDGSRATTNTPDELSTSGGPPTLVTSNVMPPQIGTNSEHGDSLVEPKQAILTNEGGFSSTIAPTTMQPYMGSTESVSESIPSSQSESSTVIPDPDTMKSSLDNGPIAQLQPITTISDTTTENISSDSQTTVATVPTSGASTISINVETETPNIISAISSNDTLNLESGLKSDSNMEKQTVSTTKPTSTSEVAQGQHESDGSQDATAVPEPSSTASPFDALSSVRPITETEDRTPTPKQTTESHLASTLVDRGNFEGHETTSSPIIDNSKPESTTTQAPILSSSSPSVNVEPVSENQMTTRTESPDGSSTSSPVADEHSNLESTTTQASSSSGGEPSSESREGSHEGSVVADEHAMPESTTTQTSSSLSADTTRDESTMTTTTTTSTSTSTSPSSSAVDGEPHSETSSTDSTSAASTTVGGISSTFMNTVATESVTSAPVTESTSISSQPDHAADGNLIDDANQSSLLHAKVESNATTEQPVSIQSFEVSTTPSNSTRFSFITKVPSIELETSTSNNHGVGHDNEVTEAPIYASTQTETVTVSSTTNTLKPIATDEVIPLVTLTTMQTNVAPIEGDKNVSTEKNISDTTAGQPSLSDKHESAFESEHSSAPEIEIASTGTLEQASQPTYPVNLAGSSSLEIATMQPSLSVNQVDSITSSTTSQNWSSVETLRLNNTVALITTKQVNSKLPEEDSSQNNEAVESSSASYLEPGVTITTTPSIATNASSSNDNNIPELSQTTTISSLEEKSSMAPITNSESNDHKASHEIASPDSMNQTTVVPEAGYKNTSLEASTTMTTTADDSGLARDSSFEYKINNENRHDLQQEVKESIPTDSPSTAQSITSPSQLAESTTVSEAINVSDSSNTASSSVPIREASLIPISTYATESIAPTTTLAPNNHEAETNQIHGSDESPSSVSSSTEATPQSGSSINQEAKIETSSESTTQNPMVETTKATSVTELASTTIEPIHSMETTTDSNPNTGHENNETNAPVQSDPIAVSVSQVPSVSQTVSSLGNISGEPEVGSSPVNTTPLPADLSTIGLSNLESTTEISNAHSNDASEDSHESTPTIATVSETVTEQAGQTTVTPNLNHVSLMKTSSSGPHQSLNEDSLTLTSSIPALNGGVSPSSSTISADSPTEMDEHEPTVSSIRQSASNVTGDSAPGKPIELSTAELPITTIAAQHEPATVVATTTYTQDSTRSPETTSIENVDLAQKSPDPVSVQVSRSQDVVNGPQDVTALPEPSSTAGPADTTFSGSITQAKDTTSATQTPVSTELSSSSTPENFVPESHGGFEGHETTSSPIIDNSKPESTTTQAPILSSSSPSVNVEPVSENQMTTRTESPDGSSTSSPVADEHSNLESTTTQASSSSGGEPSSESREGSHEGSVVADEHAMPESTTTQTSSSLSADTTRDESTMTTTTTTSTSTSTSPSSSAVDGEPHSETSSTDSTSAASTTVGGISSTFMNTVATESVAPTTVPEPAQTSPVSEISTSNSKKEVVVPSVIPLVEPNQWLKNPAFNADTTQTANIMTLSTTDSPALESKSTPATLNSSRLNEIPDAPANASVQPNTRDEMSTLLPGSATSQSPAENSPTSSNDIISITSEIAKNPSLELPTTTAPSIIASAVTVSPADQFVASITTTKPIDFKPINVTTMIPSIRGSAAPITIPWSDISNNTFTSSQGLDTNVPPVGTTLLGNDSLNFTRTYPFDSTTTTVGSTATSESDYEEITEESGCEYEGKSYNSAQQIPRSHPCDFCFCFRGDIICLQQTCPPPVPHCFETVIDGFCCPRYECPVHTIRASPNSTSLTLTPYETHSRLHAHTHDFERQGANKTANNVRGCFVDNKLYNLGQAIPSVSGPCLDCICDKSGMMRCNPKECAPDDPLLQQINREVSQSTLSRSQAR